jgi:flagellar basal-body rod protein FlgB
VAPGVYHVRRRADAIRTSEDAMAFADLNLISMLKTKMNWHQGRQQVLAENVANADTPGYRAHDLAPLNFQSHLKGPAVESVAALRTDTAHFGARLSARDTTFRSDETQGWEMTPEGNAVVLEEQMLKVSENQFDYQLASTLYQRSLGLLRMAVGRNA